jgi:hypothetical protein
MERRLAAILVADRAGYSRLMVWTHWSEPNAGIIVLPKATVSWQGLGAYLGSGMAGARMACRASFRTIVCIRL